MYIIYGQSELQNKTVMKGFNLPTLYFTQITLMKTRSNIFFCERGGRFNVCPLFIIFLVFVGLSVVTLEKALEINRISAKVGDNVEIRCDVSGNPPPPIVWKRYSADLTTLGDEDVRVFSDGSLYLTKVQLVHAGNYTCRALRNSEVTQTHVLTVHSMFLRPLIF